MPGDQRMSDRPAAPQMAQAERVVAVDQHTTMIAAFRHGGRFRSDVLGARQLTKLPAGPRMEGSHATPETQYGFTNRHLTRYRLRSVLSLAAVAAMLITRSFETDSKP